VKKLYITGISLGGALAVMSFVEIMNEFPQFTDIQVTTFGAPRVGNKQFVKYFDKLTN
jgi:predicted lipase